MRAKDVMTRAVVTTTPETTVEEIARLMINLRISGVPVLDKSGQLVGNWSSPRAIAPTSSNAR